MAVIDGRSAKRRMSGGARDANRDAAKSGKAGLVQSLGRGLSLLDSLAESPDGVCLSDLCQQVGLSVSTAHRLLTTLEQQGYVRCHPGTRRWSIGVQAFIVGSAFAQARDLVEIARPRMRSLMEESGETVNFAVLDGGEAGFLAQVEGRHELRARATPDVRVPLHLYVHGEATLVALIEDVVRRNNRRRSLPAVTHPA